MSSDADIVRQALSHFEDFQHVFLATMDGDHPRVRPVTLIYFDKRFWVTTGTRSAKIRQIQDNPNVEFCLLFQEANDDCCIRVGGLAEIIKDRETKAKIAKHCDFFSKHWESVDDPDYTLLEIRPAEITYVSPESVANVKIQHIY